MTGRVSRKWTVAVGWTLASVLCLVDIERPQTARGNEPPATGTAGTTTGTTTGTARELYWAYRPVVRPAVPSVRHPERVATPIDAFMLARLEARGLSLSPLASRETLLRRAKFDLHGLPPTPEERDEFLNDAAPDAYARFIDRLLESPHYGERWGRMWLDVVRFAESAGYNADPLRPLAYKYRDYVIESFNQDTPYDRFVQEQIAGDELFPDQARALIAAGFNRLPPDESNASNVLLARQDQLNDLTTAVGAIFLGQSLGCAQCHDHKFDEITQADFYRIQAFFAGLTPVEEMPVGTADQLQVYEQQLQEWLRQSDGPREELRALEQEAILKFGVERRMKFPAEVLEALDTPPHQRTALQQQYCFFAERQMGFTEKEFEKNLSPDKFERRRQLKLQMEQFLQQKPQPPEMIAVSTMVDGRETPKTYLLAGGSYDKPLDELQPGFLSAISSIQQAEITPPRPGTTGRRTALARWLTEPHNPLTARVMVNRIWQGHFGRGLAENANDFGVQSPPPTHPELLDWLAAEFVDRQWSLKAMHRLIMNSQVYCQSGNDRTNGWDGQESVDPGNQLYGHFDRRRLDAESLRDSFLLVSGLLNPKMGGPGIKPPLPPTVKGRDWDLTRSTAERHRRSIYILAKRNLPYPFLQTFDLPDTFESCARRQITTTGPQALTLLNDETVIDFSCAFAGRLLAEGPGATPEAFVMRAYRLAFGREAAPSEIDAGAEFIRSQSQLLAERQTQQEELLLPTPFPKFTDAAAGAALVDFCHALFNSNEFIYVD